MLQFHPRNTAKLQGVPQSRNPAWLRNFLTLQVLVSVVSPAFATVAIAAPTASIQINGKSNFVQIGPGGAMNFSWSSSNGVSAASYVGVAESCGNNVKGEKYPWAANSLEGSLSEPAAASGSPCFGIANIITYVVKDAAGATATASITLMVSDSTATGTNTNTATGSTTATSTSSDAQTFISHVSTSISTVSIDNIGKSADGGQSISILEADEAASLGASQAATIGAVLCAQGANANLTSTEDAATYYANCQQNFDAAKGMNGKKKGYNPDQSMVDGAAAQQALKDFEKNFGVSKDDYLKRMLGEGGGPGSLSGMVDGKIPEAKLTEAMDAANKLGPSDLTQEPNKKITVDLGVSPKKAPTAKLRDDLKKKLSEKSDSREIASLKKVAPSGKTQQIGDKEHLEPLAGEAIFASNGENRELTIFDVIHMRYEKLADRMHR